MPATVVVAIVVDPVWAVLDPPPPAVLEVVLFAQADRSISAPTETIPTAPTPRFNMVIIIISPPRPLSIA